MVENAGTPPESGFRPLNLCKGEGSAPGAIPVLMPPSLERLLGKCKGASRTFKEQLPEAGALNPPPQNVGHFPQT